MLAGDGGQHIIRPASCSPSRTHLGDTVLEVPISAMLILSNATRAAAVGRIAETAIGTAVGLAAGFVFTSPRLQPAEEAVEDLCRRLSDLLTAMADGLAVGAAWTRRVPGWHRPGP
jgi:hypothetical protein